MGILPTFSLRPGSIKVEGVLALAAIFISGLFVTDEDKSLTTLTIRTTTILWVGVIFVFFLAVSIQIPSYFWGTPQVVSLSWRPSRPPEAHQALAVPGFFVTRAW